MEADLGAIPPLSHADWQHAFDLYRATPQYREVAGPAGMTLAGFKFIFLWEWVHRLLGRIIGIVFLLPVLWFAAKRAIPKGYGWRLAALFVLGGAQGAIGWFMVMSGLEGRTEVSPYRLSAHLLMALFLMSALIWTALDLRRPDARPARLTGWGTFALAVLGLQLLLGAWVAGFRAGYVSNTWPAMNGRFFPDGIDWSHGTGFALTHDPFLLHFMHRWWAWVVVAVLVAVCAAGPQGRGRARRVGRDPQRVRNADRPRHPDRLVRHRDLACRASPGDRHAPPRRDRVGRP